MSVITLDNQFAEFLDNVIRSAKLLNIEQLVIDTDSVRGKSDEHSILILQKDNIPNLEFDAIGINRVNTLFSRMQLIESPKLTAELKETDNDNFVKKLLVKSKRTKVDFSCANPQYIKAPKNVSDLVFYSFNVDADAVKLMSRTVSAMKSDRITLVNDDAKVLFKMSDIDGDTLEHQLTKKLIRTEDCDEDDFVFSFKTKTLLPIFKHLATQHEIFEVNITRRGFLIVKVNDLHAYILQERD